jgi:hypothetical protein
MAAWGLGVSLRGQHEFARAGDAFAQVAAVRDADGVLIDRARVASGEMYDTVGQREQALAQYRAVVSGGHDEDYITLARKYLKHPYRFSDSSPPVK